MRCIVVLNLVSSDHATRMKKQIEIDKLLAGDQRGTNWDEGPRNGKGTKWFFIKLIEHDQINEIVLLITE